MDGNDPAGEDRPEQVEADRGEDRNACIFRFRFLNYNMGNSSSFSKLRDLQAIDGKSAFDEHAALQQPLSNGEEADMVFASLAETRIILSEWVREFNSVTWGGQQLDCASCLNAGKDGAAGTGQVTSWINGIAEKYNGNLKALAAFSSQAFAVDDSAPVCLGRLVETKVAGLALPNPKKGFVGRCFRGKGPGAPQFLLVAAHFPVAKLASALEAEKDNLESAKAVMARNLRQVLRRASKLKLLDENTVVILQGDLNSRTYLAPDGTATDVLHEVLKDTEMQQAMAHGLRPVGRWHEVVDVADPADLNVTYKYQEEVGDAFYAKGETPPDITMGEVMKAVNGEIGPCSPSDLYRQTLNSVPPEMIRWWGIQYKMNKDYSTFRPFRFPSSPDRVLYWAPAGLQRRLTFTAVNGSYKVNHMQGGSDHRPVWLEAELRIRHRRRASISRPAELEVAELEAAEGGGGDISRCLKAVLQSDEGEDSEADDEVEVDAFQSDMTGCSAGGATGTGSGSPSTSTPHSPSFMDRMRRPSFSVSSMTSTMYNAAASAKQMGESAASSAKQMGESAATSAKQMGESAATSAKQMGEAAVQKVRTPKTPSAPSASKLDPPP